MNARKISSHYYFIAFLTLVLAAGCDSVGTDGNRSSLSVSFATELPAAATTSGATLQSSHLEITEAKMLIRELKFKSDIEDDGIEDDSLDFRTDPFVVVLSLDGSVNRVGITEVDPGSYDEIEFEVHKPEDTETPPDADFRIGDSGDERFSVIITGSYDGQEFVYRSRENMDQEIELSQPLIIDETTESVNVTLTVDVSQWFVDAAGNLLNPTSPDNVNAIDESIERSFSDAFEDNDEDGLDD